MEFLSRSLYNLPLSNEFTKFAYLRLYVDKENQELRELYRNHVEKHNETLGLERDPENQDVYMTGKFPNSGFDLFVPEETICEQYDQEDNPAVTMVSMKVKAEMYTIEHSFIRGGDKDRFHISQERVPTGYFLMPRSSICKTPLILANHVGLIDMGYRGEIKAAVRSLEYTYNIQKNTRLFQLCHPETIPIYVELVENEEDFSTSSRGSGGFGSTGV